MPYKNIEHKDRYIIYCILLATSVGGVSVIAHQQWYVVMSRVLNFENNFDEWMKIRLSHRVVVLANLKSDLVSTMNQGAPSQWRTILLSNA